MDVLEQWRVLAASGVLKCKRPLIAKRPPKSWKSEQERRDWVARHRDELQKVPDDARHS